MKCLECQTEVGGKTGISIYKHIISCFHLEDRGPQQLLKELSNDDSERARRIKAMLQSAMKEE